MVSSFVIAMKHVYPKMVQCEGPRLQRLMIGARSSGPKLGALTHHSKLTTKMLKMHAARAPSLKASEMMNMGQYPSYDLIMDVTVACDQLFGSCQTNTVV